MKKQQVLGNAYEGKMQDTVMSKLYKITSALLKGWKEAQ